MLPMHWGPWSERTPKTTTRAEGRSRKDRLRRAALRLPWLEGLEDRCLLSTFNVNTTADSYDPAEVTALESNPGAGGTVSLRDAIVAANGKAGADTIVVPAGTYTLTIAPPAQTARTDDATSGSLAVTQALTIQGAGSGSTIIQGGTTATNGLDKVFSFNPLGHLAGFAVSLSGMTIRNGFNRVTNPSPGDNEGGAFDWDGGTNGAGSLTMNDVTVDHNSTTNGDGGGIALFDGGTVSITNCQFTNNTAGHTSVTAQGGAIFFGNNGLFAANNANYTISNTTISGNATASGGGGGVYSALQNFRGSTPLTATLTLSGDTITNNTAGGGNDGGGVASVNPSTLTVTSTTVSGNSARLGGGLFTGSTASVTDAVITNNSASGNAGVGGGGFAAGAGTLTVTDSRIVGNTAGAGGTAADTNGTGHVVASNNWWGTNSPPASLYGASNVTSTPYLVMSFASSKTTLNPGDTSTLTASITTNSNSQTGFSVPDGTPVTFAATHGAVNPSSTTTTSSTASSTYTPTAGFGGTASVSSTIDNQTLSITVNLDQPPAVTTNPTNQTVNAGQTATFTAAASGFPTPTVQWQVSTNGGATFSNVSGATSTTYSFTAAAGQDGNEFRAVFTNGAGSATTTAATLTVDTAPVVTTNPTSQAVNAGQSVTFTAAASGKPSPTVQWQVSTDGGATFNNVSGATSGSFTFTAAAGQNGNEYRAVFTNAAGSATTTAATLTVNTAPAVTTNPTNQTVNAGQSVTFTAAASGSPSPTVQWQVSTNGGATFSNVSGATSTTYSFTAAQGQSGNEYRAVFTNAAGSATTTAATLTVNTAPAVTTNPVSQTVNAGQSVTFTAAASGSPSPTVQWQVSTDGGATFNNVSGATSGSFTFTAAAGQNGNEYRAVFTNAAGSATTTAATLTVNTAPVVTTNPTGQVVNAGQSVTFTAAASGTPTPTVQWQVSADNGATFTDISGATSPSYTFTAAAGQDGNEFRAVFTNPLGSATTAAATLVVSSAPVVTSQPVSQTVNAGQSVTFTAQANGKPTPTVQWQVSTDGGATFSNVSGATGESYTFTASAGQDGNEFRAVFTNTFGSATTNPATLTVDTAPAVTTNPVSQTVNAGQTATFTAAASGKPSPTVQWQVSTDGGATFSNVSGATSTTYSFTAAQGQSGNEYRAVFTNAAGSATTTAATLTVNTAPVVTTNPTSQAVNAGQSVTFTAAASGTPTPTVQWQVSTDGGATFNNVSGATSGSFTFTAAAGQSGNEYRAVFTNAAGSATTTAATLTVNTAPAVTTNPVSQTVNAGQSVTFTAAASGSPSPTVQWQVSTDGGSTFTDIAGATSPSYTFTAAAGQDGNEFRAVFTNPVGSATTAAATLTVDTAPVVTTNPTSQTVNTGQSVTFTADATGKPSPTVQWQVSTDGGATFNNISGATSTSYTFTATGGQNGDEFRAVFTNAVGTATTAAATLNVQQATITSVSVSWGTAGSASLQTAADGLRLLPAGRTTDLPWLGISRITINLSQPAVLTPADVSVTGINVANYGPVTVVPNFAPTVISGPATSWFIILGRPINTADRVTVTIGNADIANFTRRLDVLPGDVNDDGVVTLQDAIYVRNMYLGVGGTTPTIFGDVNGDGVVDINDYNAVRQRLNSQLP